MNKSESITALSKALCKAQHEMKPARMNSTNPFLKNKYADLGEIIQAGRQPLANNGLSFSQLLTTDNGNIGVEIILMHESGEWISSTISLPIGDEKGRSLAQSAGAIITYLRRYSLAAILGIYADEDIDGESGTKQNETTQKSQAGMEKQQQTDGKVITKELRQKYLQLLDKAAVLGVVDVKDHKIPTEYAEMVANAKNLKELVAKAEEKIPAKGA